MTVSERIRVLFPRRQVLTAKNMTLTETHPLQDPPTVAMPLLRLVVDYCRLHGLQHGTLFAGLPVDADARLSLQAAGGDDYELAFTAPPARERDLLRDLARSGCGATRIGRVVQGEGVRLLDAARQPVALRRRGWDHFA